MVEHAIQGALFGGESFAELYFAEFVDTIEDLVLCLKAISKDPGHLGLWVFWMKLRYNISFTVNTPYEGGKGNPPDVFEILHF